MTARDRARGHRFRWGAGLLAAATIGLAVWVVTPHPVGGWFDDGIYLTTARALAAGHGFTHDWIPGGPPAVHFPPLWPLMLGGLWWLFPDFPGNIAVFKMLNPVLLGITAVLLALWARRLPGWPPALALAVVALGVLSVPMLALSTVLLSEVLFLTLLAAVLVLEQRVRRPGGVLVLGLALAALVAARSIGGVFVIATLVVWGTQRRWRDLATLASAVAAGVVPWALHVRAVGRQVPDELGIMYTTYGSVLRDAGVPVHEVIGTNARVLWQMQVAMMSLHGFPHWTRLALAGLSVALLAAGMVIAARRPAMQVAALGLAGYVLVVLCWPFGPIRFLWGLWPIVVLLIATALWALGQRLPSRARVLAAVSVALWVAVGPVQYTVRGLRDGWVTNSIVPEPEGTIAIVRVVTAEPWLRERRLAAELAPVVALYTGATVVPIGRPRADAEYRPATLPTVQEDFRATQRLYSPDAFLVLRGGIFDAALTQLGTLDGRVLTERPSGHPYVRLYLLEDLE